MLDSAGNYAIAWAVSKESLALLRLIMSVSNIINFHEETENDSYLRKLAPILSINNILI